MYPLSLFPVSIVKLHKNLQERNTNNITTLTWTSSVLCRPVHPSYGRVKKNVDGCLFAWTGVVGFFFNSYLSRSPQRRTAQSALHVMLLSYYIGMCVFHERQRDICRRRANSQGFAKAVHMSNDWQHFDPVSILGLIPLQLEWNLQKHELLCDRTFSQIPKTHFSTLHSWKQSTPIKTSCLYSDLHLKANKHAPGLWWAATPWQRIGQDYVLKPIYTSRRYSCGISRGAILYCRLLRLH